MGVKARLVEFDGERLTVAQLEEKLGWGYGTLRSRLRNGSSVEDAVKKPLGHRQDKNLCPVSSALRLTGGMDWSIGLGIAIVLQAVQDLSDPRYKRDVERFFTAGVFDGLFDLDGEVMLEKVRKIKKRGM